VRLLFDENLSPRLVARLGDVYPESRHVRELGLKSSPDRIVLQIAKLMDMILVTKDHNFDDLAQLDPDAGRVLRLDLCNCTTDDVGMALRGAAPDLPALFVENRLVSLIRR
jgi:predicted nuclease of predicted toxin-antitoxin system